MNEELDLDALRRLADAATPGTWARSGLRSIESDLNDGSWQIVVDQMNDGVGAGVIEAADAEFIAAARSAVPALLDRVREAEAELEARIEDRDYWYRIATEAKDQRDAALSTIAKVEALHQPDYRTISDQVWGRNTICSGCSESYPCPTIRALGSVPSTGEGNDAVQGS